MPRLSPALMLVLAAVVPDRADADQPYPDQVHGKYSISLVGVKVGDFLFSSRRSQQSYVMRGDIRLSAMFGQWKWRGETLAAGKFDAGPPKPDKFSLTYRAKPRKDGTVNFKFAAGRVASIDVKPVKPSPANAVPLAPKHLVDVMDPMTAIMAITLNDRADPCRLRMKVFDGTRRFDLQFQHLRRISVPLTRGFAAHGKAIVCRIRFVPIAGHKQNKRIKSLAKERGIQIALKPVPGHKVLIPVYIKIPTTVGNIMVTPRKVEFVSKGNRRIALAN